MSSTPTHTKRFIFKKHYPLTDNGEQIVAKKQSFPAKKRFVFHDTSHIRYAVFSGKSKAEGQKNTAENIQSVEKSSLSQHVIQKTPHIQQKPFSKEEHLHTLPTKELEKIQKVSYQQIEENQHSYHLNIRKKEKIQDAVPKKTIHCTAKKIAPLFIQETPEVQDSFLLKEKEEIVSVPESHKITHKPKKRKKREFSHVFSFASVKEIFKFSAVTATSFAVVLIVMNFSAYSQMFSYWYAQWTGQENVAMKNLEIFLGEGEKDNPPAIQADGTIPFLPKAGGEKPLINIPVTPLDNRIIISKIGKNVPIVEVSDTNLMQQNWDGLEKDIQEGLRQGVVHYPGTATPDQAGNFFITGHSSYYFWEKSKYKDVFALLPEVQIGDKITIFYNQKQYNYTITEKKIVKPSDVDILKQTDTERITLMTCYPIGTDLNRLVLIGEKEKE